jgi:hypothetical protein
MNGNKCVGGVEADTDYVDFECGGHLTGPNVNELERDAKRNAHSQNVVRAKKPAVAQRGLC